MKQFMISLLGIGIIAALVLSSVGVFLVILGVGVIAPETGLDATIQEIAYFNASQTSDYDITDNKVDVDGYFLVLKISVNGFSSPWWNYKVYLRIKPDSLAPDGATIQSSDGTIIPPGDFEPEIGEEVTFFPKDSRVVIK